MRFDKDLWNAGSLEYHGASILPHHVQHLTPAARVFISLWLELLQENRSPETRALRSLALPDQLSELLTSLRLSKEEGRPNYRVRAAIARLERQRRANRCPFVGDIEVTRLCEDATEWLTFVDENNQANRKASEQRLRSKYHYPVGVELGRALQQRLTGVAMGTLAQVRGLPEYKSALANFVRERLSDATATPFGFYIECSGALRELLALVLDRGNSRESLAELPIKYLRADNAAQAGRPLADRATPLFGAFWGSSQVYEVFLSIGDVALDVQGNIFPPGVTILDAAAWRRTFAGFAGIQGVSALPVQSAALHVDVDVYLNSGLAQGEHYPLDVFAARDVAVRAGQACLDAVFLYREHRIRLDHPCAVVASSPPQAGAPAPPPYRTVLHQRHEFRTRTQISLEFLRPVPAAWTDALHWFRLGNVINKDESGIVNLWTSAELLSASCHGTHGTAIERVRSSVGVVASVFLFAEQQRYLALEAIRYSRFYQRDATLNPPAQGTDDRALLEWWLHLCSVYDEAHLIDQIFDMFPLLGVEATHVKRMLAPGDKRDWYDAHRSEVFDDLNWIYGCRNDVVHDGRIRVAGASIARAVASEYVGTTLQTTLMMRARGSTTSLAECFALASEKERTLRWHLENGRILDAMLTAHQ